MDNARTWSDDRYFDRAYGRQLTARPKKPRRAKTPEQPFIKRATTDASWFTKPTKLKGRDLFAIHTIIDGRLYQSGHPNGPIGAPWDRVDVYEIDTFVDLTTPSVDKLEDDFYLGYLKLIKHPLLDASALPGLALLDQIVSEIIAELTDGKLVLTACFAGLNRSSLVNALVLRHIENISGMEAAIRIQSIVPGALSNQTFLAYLRSLSAPNSTHACIELDVNGSD